MKVLSRLAATLFSVSAGCILVLLLIANPLAECDAEARLAGTSQPTGGSLETEWMLLAGGSLFFGLLWLFSVLGQSLASSRRKTQTAASGVDAEAAGEEATSGEAGPEEMLAQFESNWKTFATYTQDILHHKLTELEEAPQKNAQELREQLGRVSEALLEVRGDLDTARTEARDSSHDLAKQVAHLLRKEDGEKEPDQESQKLLCKIERDFDKVSTGFAQLQEFVQQLGEVSDSKDGPSIEQRVTEALETFKGRWQEQADAFGGAIDHAWKRNEALLEELTRLKEAEEALRLDLAEAAVREEALHRDVEAERKRSESAAAERENARRREEDARELVRVAQEREREALKQIGALEKALGDPDTTLDSEKVATDALRRELHSLRATFENLRGENEQPESDSSPPGEEESEHHLQMQSDAPRADTDSSLLEDPEPEKDQLVLEMETLREQARELGTAKLAAEARLAIAQDERDLSRAKAEDRQQELEELLAEIDALKAERDESRTPASCESTESDRSEVERLEQEIAERDAQCRSLEEECQHHKACLEKAETEWIQRHADAQAKLDAAGEKPADAESEIDSRCQAVFSQSLSRSLPVALVVLDAHKRVVSWSHVAETVLGVTEETALGQELFVLDTPFAKTAFRKYFERCSKSRDSHRIRLRMEVKGTPAGYVLTLSPFFGEDEKVRGTILLLQPAVELAPAAR